MHYFAIVICFAILGSATPTAQTPAIHLWNGDTSVNATVESDADVFRRDAGISQGGSVLDVQTDCKGSALCERLQSCDNALRKIDVKHLYGTAPP